MKRDEIRKLLGGYATDTLTEAEREALFAESLNDQKLFDALADEEALRELLDDPAYRGELASALTDAESSSVGEKLTAWWKRPLPLALAGAVATLTVALFIVLQPEEPVREVAMTRTADRPVAELTPPPPEPAATPAEADEESPSAGSAPEEAAPTLGLMSRRDLGATSAGRLREALERQESRQGGAAVAPQPEATGDRVESEAKQVLADADESVVRAKEESGERRSRSLEVSAEPQRPTPTAVSTPAPASPLAFGLGSAMGLRATVERQTADGRFVEVRSGTRVAPNTPLRLRVHTAAAGYVYVREQRSDAAWRLIFTGEAQPGAAVYVPRTGGLAPHPSVAPRLLEVLYSPDPLPVAALESGSVLPSDESVQRINVTIEYNP